MQVQKLINDREDWLAILENDFHIGVVRDGDLVSLKYDALSSPMYEPIVQECRGMVVDTLRRKVMAHPYNKFWNLGEAHAAPIDWTTARTLEKLDGSLMILYWDDRQDGWAVASSGHPTAGGTLGKGGQSTFRDAFWDTFRTLGMRLPISKFARGHTFMFELCRAENRVVVKHDAQRLVFHGIRELESGQEGNIDTEFGLFADACNWERVQSFTALGSALATMAAAANLDPLKMEGFIVVDAAFRRVKVKSPRYVALHHLKGEMSRRRAVELWQTGEASELLTHFPEFSAEVEQIHGALEAWAAIAATYVERFGTLSRKDFALEIKDKPFSAACFRMYGEIPTIGRACEVMRGLSTAALERMLDSVVS